jgi:hypothetical protein
VTVLSALGFAVVGLAASNALGAVGQGAGLAQLGSSLTRIAITPAIASGRAVSTNASNAPNSCSIITRSQAGAALGQSVKPPVRGRATVEGGVACVFYGPHAPKGANADVPVTDSVRVVLVSGPKAKVYFDDYRSRVHAQRISGLGNQAYYDGYASLSVLKGRYYVRIAVIGVRNVLAAEKTLAVDALHRL